MSSENKSKPTAATRKTPRPTDSPASTATRSPQRVSSRWKITTSTSACSTSLWRLTPHGLHELDLLTEAVFAKAAQLEVAVAQDESHLANAVAKSEQILKLYLRYDAQFNRIYRNYLKDLRDLRAQRHIPEPEEEPAPIEPKSETQATPNEPKLTPEQQAAETERLAFQHHVNRNLGRRLDYEVQLPPRQPHERKRQ